MAPELLPYLIVCPMVFLAGVIDAIAGGGGLISLPAYILAGVPIHNALATNKMSSFLGTIVSTFRYWRNSFVDVMFILPSVGAALVGSIAGAKLVLLVQARYLEYMLIIVLPITGFIVLRRKTLGYEGEPLPRRKACIIAIFISLAVGLYDGFYGPGTGTFLILLYSTLAKMGVRNAIGSSKFVNLASNCGAFFTFLLNGTMWIPLGLAAGAFSILGHWMGAGLAIKRGTGIVRPVVMLVLALLFVKVVVG